MIFAVIHITGIINRKSHSFPIHKKACGLPMMIFNRIHSRIIIPYKRNYSELCFRTSVVIVMLNSLEIPITHYLVVTHQQNQPPQHVELELQRQRRQQQLELALLSQQRLQLRLQQQPVVEIFSHAQ